MRHCEKGNLKKHCDYIGLERSVYLASLFGDKNERWPTPAYIFAESPDGRRNSYKRNYREVETAGPLSQKTGVEVDASYNTVTESDLVDYVADLLKRGDLCGKLVVIVWKHSGIGRLARKLGCGHDQGCPDDYRGKNFDEIWQLRYVYNFVVGPNVEYHHHNRPRLWQVFGSVQDEGFDPLAFSKTQGVGFFVSFLACMPRFFKDDIAHIAFGTLRSFKTGLSRWRSIGSDRPLDRTDRREGRGSGNS